MTFELLNIRPEVIRALKDHGITSPTKIQKLAIPIVLSGKDLVAISNTGSGKTAAFGIPVIEKIQPNKGLQVLILAPTRELAVQISAELAKFAKHVHCNIATVYGGVGYEPQIRDMRKAEIVVSTTGRFLDHMQQGNVGLKDITCVVLDEADKMVDMGFINDIERIMSQAPKNKQVLLFGATISDEINHLKRKHMNNPETAKAAAHVKEDFLEQKYYDVQPHEKFSLLVHLLKKEDTDRVIIFCATRGNVESLTRNLKDQGIRAEALHGKLPQAKRLRIVENFNKGKPEILVASAVAARGLDIKYVSHVFNYGLSNDPQEYVHRVGRTARAGASGTAITLLEPRDYEAFNEILHRYHMDVKKADKVQFPKVAFKVNKNFARNAAGPRNNYARRGPGRGNNRGPRTGRGRRRDDREGARSESTRVHKWNRNPNFRSNR